jgi:hypothetical protein
VALGFAEDDAGVLHAPADCRLRLTPSKDKLYFEVRAVLPSGNALVTHISTLAIKITREGVQP